MEKIAEQIDVLNVDFTKKGDLIYHEGPILSHFVGNKGHDYFFYWVDIDDEYNRWMVFEVTNNGLKNFFGKKSRLLDLVKLSPSSHVYYIDIDDDINFKRFFRSGKDNIPTSYLPSEKSFYNERHYEKYADVMKRHLLLNVQVFTNRKFALLISSVVM